MKTIKNETYDKERSLYSTKLATVESCTFKDPENVAESPLKECIKIDVTKCEFHLRYPLWHVYFSRIKECEFFETSRAALWYDHLLKIENCKLNGIKALRECSDIIIKNCEANSAEFGWSSKRVSIDNFKLVSEYPFLHDKNLKISNLNMKGKYSFQYCDKVKIKDSVLDTKDAFWHANNVVIENCDITGEYIGWYSNKLTFINCKIKGTQPFCYCKNLKLINCELIDADLAFEYSSVKADLIGSLISVKNPRKGYINVDKVDEIIIKDSVYPTKCKINQRKK